jgi:hypothetical protein
MMDEYLQEFRKFLEARITAKRRTMREVRSSRI